jgi:FkbM family methyltransferase
MLKLYIFFLQNNIFSYICYMNKNLLFIVPHLSTGGAPQFTLNKIELLRNEYNILCIEYNCISSHFVVQRNKIIEILKNDFISLSDNKSELLNLIDNFNPDTIFIEEFSESFINEEICEKIYKKDRKYKIIESTHSSNDFSNEKKYFPDKFNFVSKYSAKIYEKLGVDYEVIEYPIDKKNKNNNSKEFLNFSKDYKHILNVGLFTPGKNQSYAFELARKLEEYNVKFHFVGNQAGNFEEYWIPLMLNIPNNCIVHGEKDNVEDFLMASDLFLFTSKFELNPLVVKEAIMFDMPILMFNLETYLDSYNKVENVNFLNGNIEEDIEKIIKTLELEKDKNYIHYDFIEIGTSDFDTLIEESDDLKNGISIEPIKFYIDRLPNKKNVKKIQAAMSNEEGSIDIYYIEEEKILKNNLPWWVRGSNSINKPHPFTIKEIGKSLYDELVTIEKVPTITWNKLINDYKVKSIDFLKIDTEGYDHIILEEYLKECEKNPNLLANKIKFENHKEVSNQEEIEKIIKKFKGYNIERLETDVILTKHKIPRIIHQTYKTKELPKELIENVNKIKEMNPDFEYRFYDDNDCEEFIKDNYDKETLDIYLNINSKYSSARADFFRYLLMYKIGGVYLDIKSSTIVPLNQVLLDTDEYLLSHWPGKDWSEDLKYEFGEFQNWHIVCKPEHPFLLKVIEDVKKNIRNYNGEKGKKAVLEITGPITYSKSILSLLNNYKTNFSNSPVREFLLSEEIGLNYMNTNVHHHNLYKSYSEEDEIIKNNDLKKGYVLYSNKEYLEISKQCIKSIREYSNLPIYLYVLNYYFEIEDIENVFVINWKFDLKEDKEQEKYIQQESNFYINRNNKSIYSLLIQRPVIVKDVLEKYLDIVAYIDSDSISTKYVDNIFNDYDFESKYPLFVEGIYDYLHVGNRGGAETKEDLSTTLEHPLCELFQINQNLRERYRQTGYFVSGRGSIDFLEEWYWMCKNPKIEKDISYYAPYNEETVLNVLLWKYNIQYGLKNIYVNAKFEDIDLIYNKIGFNGSNNLVGDWLRIPENKEDLMFFHGEKNIDNMQKMIEELKKY